MKTYKYFLAALIVVACFACNKKLDVQPQNNVTDIQTGDDVEALLFGGYSLLQNASAFVSNIFLLPTCWQMQTSLILWEHSQTIKISGIKIKRKNLLLPLPSGKTLISSLKI